MYGWAPEEAIGRRSHDLLKTEFPEPLEKIQERLMERGNVGRGMLDAERVAALDGIIAACLDEAEDGALDQAAQ